jgi:hypothetical protein
MEELDVWIHVFLTSALAVGEWSTSHLGPFSPGERAPGTHWLGCWVGPRAGLDDVEKRKFLILPELELRALGCPARSCAIPTALSQLLDDRMILNIKCIKSGIAQSV